MTFVIYSLRMGGAERILTWLANALAAEGVSVRVLTLRGAGEAPFYPLDSRVHIVSLDLAGRPRSPASALAVIRRLRGGLLASRPDVIVSFMHTANEAVLLASTGSRIPVVVCERSNPRRNAKGLWWGFLRRLTYPLARAVVVLNDRCATFFDFIPAGKVVVIPNPVAMPPQADVPLRDTVILTVGRLNPVKRHDLLIRAFHAVSARLPGWSLVVHGEGKQRPHLESLVRALGLEGRVFLPGLTRDPQAVMRQASIYALTSDYEGFPNALCEAMACGMAVVAVDCETGPREIVTHGEDGILVPPGNVDALAEALLSLATNPEMRRQLGINAARITERFPVESTLGHWRKLLDGIVLSQSRGHDRGEAS